MKKIFMIGLFIFCIFGLLGTILWFTVNNKYERQEIFEKVYKYDKIDQIIINGQNTNIEVKHGKNLKVKYQGNHSVSSNIENNLLHFSEREKKFNLNANFIPFKKTYNCLIITLPKKDYDAINISTNTGNVRIKGINAQNSNIITGTGNITYDDVDLKYSKSKSDLGSISIDQSRLMEFNGEIDTGNISIDETRLVDSELITSIGNIKVNNLKNECNIKSSTEDGNIDFSYKTNPKNTLLQLQSEKGETNIRNSNFKGEKIGTGEHVIEAYTVKGDINIH